MMLGSSLSTVYRIKFLFIFFFLSKGFLPQVLLYLNWILENGSKNCFSAIANLKGVIANIKRVLLVTYTSCMYKLTE